MEDHERGDSDEEVADVGAQGLKDERDGDDEERDERNRAQEAEQASRHGQFDSLVAFALQQQDVAGQHRERGVVIRRPEVDGGDEVRERVGDGHRDDERRQDNRREEPEQEGGGAQQHDRDKVDVQPGGDAC